MDERTRRVNVGAASAERGERWRRALVTGQGTYYLLVGIWPLVHFSSFARLIALPTVSYQAQAFGAVLAVIGANLLESARREAPAPVPTLLGATVAGAIAVVGLVWLPRLRPASVLWVDLILEVAFAVGLIVLYPRSQAERGRTLTRRR